MGEWLGMKPFSGLEDRTNVVLSNDAIASFCLLVHGVEKMFCTSGFH